MTVGGGAGIAAAAAAWEATTYASLICGCRVVSLDRDADRDPGPGLDAWKEWLACDNRVGPADEAAFRIDFAAWLDGLPGRKCQIAERLENRGAAKRPRIGRSLDRTGRMEEMGWSSRLIPDLSLLPPSLPPYCSIGAYKLRTFVLRRLHGSLGCYRAPSMAN